MNPSHNNDGRNRSATPPPQPDKKDEEKKESLPGAGRIQSLPHDRSSGEGIGGTELVGSGAEPLPRPQLVLNIVSSDSDVPMHCEQGQDNIPFFNSPIQGICNKNKMLF